MAGSIWWFSEDTELSLWATLSIASDYLGDGSFFSDDFLGWAAVTPSSVVGAYCVLSRLISSKKLSMLSLAGLVSIFWAGVRPIEANIASSSS